ncbi:hypothetical protein ACH5RR_008768 [Cinchona calisaya]|uniref:Uncharacterized protein n=1 Tax=Cinchona calisaya TaxID=153742 RepID=A0ABD3ACF4_9GENT
MSHQKSSLKSRNPKPNDDSSSEDSNIDGNPKTKPHEDESGESKRNKGDFNRAGSKSGCGPSTQMALKHLTVMKPPQATIQAIERVMARFFWGESEYGCMNTPAPQLICWSPPPLGSLKLEGSSLGNPGMAGVRLNFDSITPKEIRGLPRLDYMQIPNLRFRSY